MSKMGKCRLCGKTKKMTAEHVPPQSAYNDQQIRFTSFSDFFASNNTRPLRYKTSKNGMKQWSLCAECNKSTGHDYVPAFTEWTNQAYSWLEKLNEWSGIPLRYEIQPLNVLKQILLMRLAWLPTENLSRYREWQEYIQDRESKKLPANVRIYAYFNQNKQPRIVDVDMEVMRVDINALDFVEFELALRPLGYCITLNDTKGSKSLAREQGLTDITWFSELTYKEKKEIYLELPLKEAHISFPLEYRTKLEIDEHNHNYGIADS